MEERITTALRQSSNPLTANEIAKVIGRTKKEVNQTIHRMNGVEKLEEATERPKWRLTERDELKSSKSSTKGQESSPNSGKASVESTRTPERSTARDENIKEVLVRFLGAQSSPVSAPDISRRIDKNVSCDTANIKRVLYEMEREGTVMNHSLKGDKPMWTLKDSLQGNKDHVTMCKKLLYTFDEESDGTMKFKPVTQSELEAGSLQTTTGQTDEAIIPEPDSGQAVNSPPHETQTTSESGPQDLGLPFPSTSEPSTSSQPCKKKNSMPIAANFSNLSLQDNVISDEKVLRQKVVQFLESNPDQEFLLRDITERIGFPTRDKVLCCLESLVEQNLVEKLENKHYKIICNK